MRIEAYGTCAHCGQRQAVTADDFYTQDQLDILASENCDCPGGQRLRFEKMLDDKLERTLGAGSVETGMDYALEAAAIDFARAAARAIWEGSLDSASFAEPHGDAIKIREKDGAIQIERTHRKQIRM